MANLTPLEKILQCLDQLRSTYANQLDSLSIDIPCVVVVGSEKAGKSTLMEHVLGLHVFPHAAQLMTRTAIEFRVRSITAGMKLLHVQN